MSPVAIETWKVVKSVVTGAAGDISKLHSLLLLLFFFKGSMKIPLLVGDGVWLAECSKHNEVLC